MPGALELAQMEVRSTLYPQLLPYTLQCEIDSSVDSALVDLLLDPQTSGGLLVTLPKEEASQLCAALESAVEIGFVEGSHKADERIKLV